MAGESDIEQAGVKLIREEFGLKMSKLVVPGDSGFPDRIVWMPGGKPCLIEVKDVGETPEPHQLAKHEFLRRLGYDVTTQDSVTGIFGAVYASAIAIRQSSHKPSKKFLNAKAKLYSEMVSQDND